MSTRTAPMPLDGHSLNADLLADSETTGKVEVVILDILHTTGPLVDDTITALYESRAEHYPGVPKVTPQRVRTARASLTRRGLVIDSGRPGKSALGNSATVWELHLSETAAA